MFKNKAQRDFARHLRKKSTDTERRLWSVLRCRQLKGFKFRRQAAIGNYIVDFVCFDEKLVIELDGGQHNKVSTENYDQTQTEWLNSQGFRVLRLWNHELFESEECIADVIWKALLPPSPALPTRGRAPE